MPELYDVTTPLGQDRCAEVRSRRLMLESRQRRAHARVIGTGQGLEAGVLVGVGWLAAGGECESEEAAERADQREVRFHLSVSPPRVTYKLSYPGISRD